MTRLSLSWSANSFWIQLSGPDHPSSGISLNTKVGSRSFLFSCISEDQGRNQIYGRDQIIPLLVYLWSLWSGPDHPSSRYLWSLWSGPDHLSSGVSLTPMVGTRSSLFWCISEAYGRDQIIPLLVHLWSLWLGPDQPSSGVSLKPTVGTRSSLFWVSLKPMVGTKSSLFWCISEAYGRDQIIPLLVHLWSLWSGPDHPSSSASVKPMVGTRSSLFWCIYSMLTKLFPAYH